MMVDNRRLDTTAALARYTQWALTQARGLRWASNGFNNNIFPSTVVLGLTLAGSPQPQWTIDEDRRHTYGNFTQTNTQYMYNVFTGTFGPWGGGTSSWLPTTYKGHTSIVWARCTAHTANIQGVFSAWDASTSTAAWRIQLDPNQSNKVRASISNTGSYVSGLEAFSTAAFPTGRWCMIALVFRPSTSIKLYVCDGDDIDIVSNTTSIPANTYTLSKTIYVGATKTSGGVMETMNGDIGYCTFAENRMPEQQILDFYNFTRKIYGV